MKKTILLLGCLSLLTLGLVSVSCNKEEEWKGCRCTLSGSWGSETKSFAAQEVRAEGLNSCSALESDIRRNELSPGERISCSNL